MELITSVHFSPETWREIEKKAKKRVAYWKRKERKNPKLEPRHDGRDPLTANIIGFAGEFGGRLWCDLAKIRYVPAPDTVEELRKITHDILIESRQGPKRKLGIKTENIDSWEANPFTFLYPAKGYKGERQGLLDYPEFLMAVESDIENQKVWIKGYYTRKDILAAPVEKRRGKWTRILPKMDMRPCLELAKNLLLYQEVPGNGPPAAELIAP
jgi:hypothetical protein